MLESVIKYLLFVSVVLLMNSCANVGSPSGGIKDEIPPKVVKSKPVANKLGFDGDKIEITFDEIVVLKDLTSNFLVSPPMLENPDVSVYGDELTVEFEDTLRSNTVYTLYFGNAIVDNNEGNVLKNYSFSFSTGFEIDTMRLQGYVIDAQTLNPISGTIVGIYTDYSDSSFINQVPLRIAKTDAKGFFSINNVRPGKYIVRAITDLNNNYRFDQPGEQIAFLESEFETSLEHIILMDSIFLDSIGENKEHIKVFQELRPRDSVLYYPDSIILKAFTEYHPFQVLKTKERKQENRLDYAFADKILEEPKIRLLDDEQRTDWYLSEYSGDSLKVMYWVRDTALTKLDTIAVIFDYQVTDTAEQYVWKSDTLQMRFKRKKTKKSRQEKKADKAVEKGGKPQKPKVEPLKVELSIKGSVNYFDDIILSSPQPVASLDESAIKLYEIVNDSTMKSLKFTFGEDEKEARAYRLVYRWNQNKKYLLTIDSASIYDIYGATNDSIGKRFSVVPEEKFSTIYLNITNLKGNAVVQLMNSTQKVLETQKVIQDQEIGFFYLKPDKYYFSLFYDTNDNGKWDVGNYLEKRQAEEVRFFPKMIETKAYYEMEDNWDVEGTSILDQKPKSLKSKDKKK